MVGVSHDVQRAQMCVFFVSERGQVHDSSVSAWTQKPFRIREETSCLVVLCSLRVSVRDVICG